jgi:hypothetical protein
VPQPLTRGLVVAQSLGLLLLGPGGALHRRGANSSFGTTCNPGEAEVFLDGCEFVHGAAVVVPVPRRAQITAHLGGDDVDVVLRVTHSNPAAAVRIAVGCDAGRVHHAPGDGGPLGVGEDAVLGRGADRAVPHVPLRRLVAGLLDPQIQGLSELAEPLLVARAVPGTGVGNEVVPGGDDVLVGVFVGAAFVEEVGQHAVGPVARLDDVRDHFRPPTSARLPGRRRRRSPGLCRGRW